MGAGPAGLAFANRLNQLGEDSFIVLEKENESGGLCRSRIVDNAPFDIGGGHFLDVRRPKVNKFLFGFMPENEWDIYERDSRIEIEENLINHPIEANIWQMDVEKQVEYLKSIAIAGCNLNKPMPDKFVDWILWKLGDRIATDYMIPYNQKMFGENLNQLGTYWLEKLPNVSFEETLMSCLNKKMYGTQPGHAQFYYPKKFGYGELWLRMAKKISDKIEYNKSICKINFNEKKVTDKSGKEYQAERIIITIPWCEFEEIVGMPTELQDDIKKLKYSSIQTEYHSQNIDTKAQWIYYPSAILKYHRILVRHNFCPNSRGYWTETNADRIDKDADSEFKYMNQFAYPLNTINKPEIMKKLLLWAEKKGVVGLGRWGEWEHYNSDVVVLKAMELAEKIGNI